MMWMKTQIMNKNIFEGAIGAFKAKVGRRWSQET
jgi:hypothetical protein